MQPPNLGAAADFGPPAATITFTFSPWAEAAELGTLGDHMASDRVESWPFEPVVWEIVALLAKGEYVSIERRTGGIRLSAEEIGAAVAEYPGRFIVPPPEARMDVVEVEVGVSVSPAWSVWLPLWTAEEGRSDLTLELTIRAEAEAHGGYAVELDDLHVL